MGNNLSTPHAQIIFYSVSIIFLSTAIIFFFKKQKTIENTNNNFNENKNIEINNYKYIENIKDYDIVVDLPNVDTFVIDNGSWTIYINKDLLENVKADTQFPLDVILEGSKKFRTATVIGYFKRGKTFIINLINNSNLPSGSQTKTKGLSISISHINETLFIDTQGSNTPLQYFEDDNENEELKKAYKINSAEDSIKLSNLHLARKKATESFIQETAVSLSNVVIFVVNELTWNDQQNILSLQKKIKTQNPTIKQSIKQLYVFHNYMNIDNMEELMAMIKTYVTNPFKGDFHTEFFGDEYIIYYTDAENLTTHFFLCDHKSQFGNKWNELVGFFVRNKIKSVANQNYEFDTILLETLKEKMKSNIKVPTDLKIIPFINTESQIVQHQNKETKKYSFVYKRKTGIPPKEQKVLEILEEMFNQVKPNSIDINQTPAFSIVPKVKGDIERWKYALNNKDIIYIDNFLVLAGSYNPNYDRLECDNNTLVFTFDLPDVPENQFNHYVDYDKNEDVRILKISGTRKLKFASTQSDVTSNGEFGFCHYPSQNVKISNSLNPRKEGEFDLRIPFGANYSKNYEKHFENGVLTLTFKEEIGVRPDESCNH